MTFSVAMLANRFPVRSETFIVRQIAGLMGRGIHVDIYSRHGTDGNCLPLHPDIRKFKMLDRLYHQFITPKTWHPSTRLHRLARHLNKSLLNRQWKGLPRLGRIEPESRCGRKPYDIVHCQFGYLGLGLSDLPAYKNGLLSGKLVVALRGSDISQYVQTHGERVYDELFRTADLFLANCEHFRQRAIKLGCDPEKVAVLGSGIDLNQVSYSGGRAHRDGMVRILGVGRLVEKKGFEFAIRAVARLIKDRGNISFEIVGCGPLRGQLQQLISDLGVEKSIRLVGPRNSPEVVDKLRRSDLFVATSVTSQRGNQDGPVNTLKEAMAVGLPVLATVHGGISELVQDGVCGFLVPERNVEALASRLAYLIDHPDLWPDFGLAGRRRVEKMYNINSLTDDLVETYERLLGQRIPLAA